MKLMLQVSILISLIGSMNAFAQDNTPVSNSSPPLALTQNSMDYAMNPDVYTYRTLMGTLAGRTGSVFVVPAEETAVEELLAVNEDMTVMTRIFSRALEQANLRSGPDNPYMPLIGQRGFSTPSIYLAGYGALFTLSVDFPLVPGSEGESTTPQEAETGVDPIWQQTRADIFDPQLAKRRTDSSRENGPNYNAQQVETLKATLIATLKHAANIRALAPDEVVVIAVVGPSQPGQVQSIRSVPGSNEYEFIDNQGRRLTTANRLGDLKLSAPTILMIRAKATAINSFAKGQLGLEQFREQVGVLEYPHLGQMRESSPGPFLPSISYRGR